MTGINLLVVLTTVLMSAVAQLLLKMGVQGELDRSGVLVSNFSGLLGLLFAPMVILGLMIYAFSVLAWLWVLSRLDLSLAYPFVGVSFIVTLMFGVFVLNESVTPARIVGTLLIAVGCVFVARSV